MLPVTPGSLKIDGQRQQGENVRVQNVRAAMAVANVVRSSLGPIGLDKMLVDDIGEVTITNDGATILNHLDVQHPAGKVLIQLSELQDREVGDGTTTVVLLAAELLRLGQDLINKKVHANTIITGYRAAAKKAIAFLKKSCAVSNDNLDREILLKVAKTSMNSKILNAYSDFFGNMVVDACLAVKTPAGKCPTNRVNIVKSLGKSLPESTIVTAGVALNATRATEAFPRRLEKVKVAVLDFGLQRTRLPMGIQFRLHDASKLEAIQQEEVNAAERAVQAILKAGANVIVTSKTIDEASLKPLVKAGAIGIRHVSDAEIAHLARSTGATVVSQLISEDGGETFDPAWLGEAELIEQVPVGDNQMTIFRGCAKENSASIVLRGPNTFTLEEANRSLRDALFAVKRVIESKHIVAGGGAVEAALSVYLSQIAKDYEGKEQVAMLKFGEALLVIPKILANNAALDSIDLVAKLRAVHYDAQQKGEKCFAALDLVNGKIRDGMKDGVIEPGMSKVKSIQFATEAAITILRIDDLIKVTPEKKPDRNEEE
ncbi:chaperonin subunit alpha1 CCTalpha, putative [Trichomonas vaginalis G3]|uniref:Chaperonin subunit alpha1 CCTalpha, putative n=1 Tax=Trichomonas vaginalis (strain ATCC PRA-98 / G3) TaxID=412133 RepID=A2E9D9_TRIV3|nr:chaperonin subunit alpha1 CCTalpha [Trichomonas vaginalis G3]EAY10703.1 chaperonin subunit alpha1 CCTalpha, putative [Trichomonas vaginalis G3]KAI5538596.1 chaperonin subunit alpha1 CCTalpha [Trichomonas vaginalis G3]|eukprot:XP_001322926.1 chaperonin subunit alpha1 CCTalpha [Trichomonas vaginalis G3]